jgi:hypothetical protein
VTLEQALEEARKLYPGLKLTPATARVWAHRGLIPKAEAAPGQGMGRGRVGDYSSDVPAQVAAAGFVKRGLRRRFQDAEIARARLFWLSGGKAQGEEAEAILPGFLSLASYDSWFGVGTMESLHRALDIVIYASRLEMARRGMDIRQHSPAPDSPPCRPCRIRHRHSMQSKWPAYRHRPGRTPTACTAHANRP